VSKQVRTHNNAKRGTRFACKGFDPGSSVVGWAGLGCAVLCVVGTWLSELWPTWQLPGVKRGKSCAVETRACRFG
jgi:hypothetical protein